ncbi:hypothetical protein KAR34_05345, partial [bacterium]|nr:hypothetical protein [bacterium]
MTGIQGNISSDPLFINETARNYHLNSGSPANDAGNPDSAYNDPDDTRNDMGAFGGPLEVPPATPGSTPIPTPIFTPTIAETHPFNP